MLADLRLDKLAAMCLQAFVRPLLVGSHQPRIARHISGEDRGEAAGRDHPYGNRRILLLRGGTISPPTRRELGRTRNPSATAISDARAAAG